MRPLRALAATTVGFFAGFGAAAAVVKRALPSRGDTESDEVALVAIFGGVALRSRAKAFVGGSMLAWFGGVAVDLREATLAPEAHLSLAALTGGIALKVPPGWRVETNVNAFAGGVEIDVPEPDDPDAPRLTLDGFALFGGVAVAARPRDEPEG